MLRAGCPGYLVHGPLYQFLPVQRSIHQHRARGDPVSLYGGPLPAELVPAGALATGVTGEP